MVGGYQILDLSNYEFILDPATGDCVCHVEGAYNIVTRNNKPIMVSSVNYTDGTRVVYPSQFVVFNANSDGNLVGNLAIYNGHKSIVVTNEDYVSILG